MHAQDVIWSTVWQCKLMLTFSKAQRYIHTSTCICTYCCGYALLSPLGKQNRYTISRFVEGGRRFKMEGDLHLQSSLLFKEPALPNMSSLSKQPEECWNQSQSFAWTIRAVALCFSLPLSGSHSGPSGKAPWELLLFWPNWKWLWDHLDFIQDCYSKWSDANSFKQLWLRVHHHEPRKLAAVFAEMSQGTYGVLKMLDVGWQTWLLFKTVRTRKSRTIASYEVKLLPFLLLLIYRKVDVSMSVYNINLNNVSCHEH